MTVRAGVVDGVQGPDVAARIDKALAPLRADAAGRLSHRGRRRPGGERQEPGLDLQDDAGDGAS